MEPSENAQPQPPTDHPSDKPDVGSPPPKGSSSPAPRPPATKRAARPLIQDPAKTLISVVPRWLVVTFATVSFVGVSALVLYGLIINKAAFEDSTGRFLMCLLASLYIAVFVFVTYPAQHKVTYVPWLSIPVYAVGLFALWVIVFTGLLFYAPTSSGQFFRAESDPASKIKIPFPPDPAIIQLVPQNSGNVAYLVSEGDHLTGVFVEFHGADHETITLKTEFGQATTVLKRGEGRRTFKLNWQPLQ